MLSFKWKHFRQDVILLLVRWYIGYSLSYRDVEELALERGLKIDHSTINRWVVEYSLTFLQDCIKATINFIFSFIGAVSTQGISDSPSSVWM
ncbi:hypothetical protein BN59_03052 [Legionella massiliensis]|uniref:Transposase IS66 family protein n=1 Tax=Legionella massiliensis TaxID=1034943 RepID=A0A078L3P2_9GAMM|nr:hypothetical protein BN59_03052 [Legionella massiliensis]CEE14477.1 hypothetical protein BN1094_03052 [Legionella massiliensis]